MKDAILEELAGFPGNIGFYFENLATGEQMEYRSEKRFLAASVIKFPLLCCILKWASEGKADLSERLVVHNEDKVPICGALTLFSDEPQADLMTLCRLMISISDNTATNLLISRFGIDSFREEFPRIGLVSTSLERRLFDSAASASGLENRFSPKELGILLKRIYRKEFVSEAVSEEIEDILCMQQISHKIPGYLPDVRVANKTGEDDEISNDVGIVFAKQPFIVCFAGNEVSVRDWEIRIRELSLRLYERCSM